MSFVRTPAIAVEQQEASTIPHMENMFEGWKQFITHKVIQTFCTGSSWETENSLAPVIYVTAILQLALLGIWACYEESDIFWSGTGRPKCSCYVLLLIYCKNKINRYYIKH